MIEIFNEAEHLATLAGRIVIQSESSSPSVPPLACACNAYRVKSVRGTQQVLCDPLRNAPKKSFLITRTLSVVCDTEKEMDEVLQVAELCRIEVKGAYDVAVNTITAMANRSKSSEQETKELRTGNTKGRTRARVSSKGVPPVVPSGSKPKGQSTEPTRKRTRRR